MTQTVYRKDIPTIVCPLYIGEDLNLSFKREVTLTTGNVTTTYLLNASELSFEDETNEIVWTFANGHILQTSTNIIIFCAETEVKTLKQGVYNFVLFREAVAAQKTAMMNVSLDLK